MTDTTTHPTSMIISQLLIDAGLAILGGGNGDWQVFIAVMPECAGGGAGDNAIAIYDLPGTRDGRYSKGGQIITHPGLQIRVRSSSYIQGWTKAKQIADLIDATDRATTVTVDASIYRMDNLSRLAAVTPNGREPGTRRRDIFTVNLNTTITQTT